MAQARSAGRRVRVGSALITRHTLRGVIRTRLTEMFALDFPVMSAPMALHSGGTLAGAVTAAGGLGSFGGAHPDGPDWLRSQFDIARRATDGPLAVGFITPFLGFTEPMFAAALDQRPAVVAFSFSDPTPWLHRAKACGARTMCQVQNFDDADRAVDAGTDILVAQGSEAGGHTGTMGLLPLLTGLVDRFPEIPVLAAGGLCDGASLAAVLTAGADGAWMGSAFLATPEAVEIHDDYKQMIIDSDGADTVFTRAYDIVSGLPWPSGIGERVRRNRFTDEWAEREGELRSRRDEFAGDPGSNPFSGKPDPDTDSVLYGQGSGSVTAIRPAADVLRSICSDAEVILTTRPGHLVVH